MNRYWLDLDHGILKWVFLRFCFKEIKDIYIRNYLRTYLLRVWIYVSCTPISVMGSLNRGFILAITAVFVFFHIITIKYELLDTREKFWLP